MLATRWGVWLGSATLLLAGVFLVRYAAEAGFFGPAVRCALAAVLGAALIAGGDRARRHPVPGLPYPDQVPAALVAGGVAVLFGAAYAAGVMFALVPLLLAFAMMAAVSLAAMVLSLRFGQLVAAVGVAGAFVTPALVQTGNPSWPGLYAYLLFVTAAALAVVRFSAWVWLGWATTVAGAAWVLIGTLAGTGTEDWAPAMFVPALAALHVALLPGAALDHPVGRKLALIPVAAVGAAGLLLCFADPNEVTRAGVLLLAPVTIAAAWREPRLTALPFVAAALFLLLLAGWGLAWQPPVPDAEAVNRMPALPAVWIPAALRSFLWTGLAMSAVFAAAGLAGERRSGRPLPWSALVAAVPVLALAIGFWRVRAFQTDALWAAAGAALAAGLTEAAMLAEFYAPWRQRAAA